MCIIDCLSTIVFILPLHLDDTKVIILILWWRTFQLEYWRTFQLVSTGYDEEGCETAGNIQPEQALTEQFPVFAHCLVLRLHRFQLRRTVIQLSACLSRYEEQQQGASRCGGNDQPQPETVTPFTQRTQPEIPFPTSRTGVRPPPSADNPPKPQQQDSRHDQVAVPRMRLQPLRQTLHKLAYLIEPFHSNNRKSQIHTLRTNRYTSKQK